MKPLCGLLVLALGACQTPAPDAARSSAAYQAALGAGDAERALGLLRTAAPGDLRAHAQLSEAYERGYLVRRDTLGGPDVRLPIRTLPGQASLEAWRLERHLGRAAEAGDPDAMLALARRGSETIEIRDGKLVPAVLDPSQRRLAEATYQRLVGEDVDRFQLGMLAHVLGDSAAYRRHVSEAAAQGDPTACDFKIWFMGGDDRPSLGPAEGLALYYDRVAACRPGHPIPSAAMRSLRDLRAQLDQGNPAAAVALDSLRQLGVFERHPELAVAIGPDAPT